MGCILQTGAMAGRAAYWDARFDWCSAMRDHEGRVVQETRAADQARRLYPSVRQGTPDQTADGQRAEADISLVQGTQG